MADGQRNEKPTSRRLEKARKEGRFPASRELTTAVQFFALVYLVSSYGGEALNNFATLARRLIVSGFQGEWTPARFAALLRTGLSPWMFTVALAMLALPAAAAAAQLASTGLGLAPSRLAPELSRLNPFDRLKQFPAERAMQFFKAILLLPLALVVVAYMAQRDAGRFLDLGRTAFEAALARTLSSLVGLLWTAAAVLLILAVLDYVWQRHKFTKSLRMTKQEVRDEHKESEGNPEIKMRVRRLQRDLARRNMMKEIPNATAVIVNPTHYAVAIRYRMETPGAPTVVAKGKNWLALRIRQRAVEHGIPVVENQPLAQALYKAADVGQEIPPHLYRAVAEILAYIFKLMNGRLPG